MDTKDVEWLGVWHSIAELPVASGRWTQTGSEGKNNCYRHIASNFAASIVGLRITIIVIIDLAKTPKPRDILFAPNPPI